MAIFIPFPYIAEGKINEYSPATQRTVLYEPPAKYIGDVCITNELMVVEFGSPTMETYDYQTKIWKIYSNILREEMSYRCFITAEKQLVVYGKDQIKVKEGDNWSSNLWKMKGELKFVIQDEKGTYWAITSDGYIFFSEYLEGEWQLFHNPTIIAYKIFCTSNTLWLLSYDGVYRFTITNPENNPIKVLGASVDDGPTSVIEISSGKYWIFTYKNFWEYQQENLNKSSLPWLTEHINSVAFDKIYNRIYISTNRGIYYKNI
jgi:hypothetical protein